MTPIPAASALLSSTLALTAALAGFASLINALELYWMMRDGTLTGMWRDDTMAAEWGALRPVLRTPAFPVIVLAQGLAAVALMVVPHAGMAGVLVGTTYLAAVRMRGNVNGGSDAMLFTVLSGLTLALSDAPLRWREAGLVYVAAQLTLSYLRAGLVKVVRRSWWTGDALRVFVHMPAYGVPVGRWATPLVLRAMSVGVLCFECSAPLAFVHPTVCVVFLGTAVVFHAATAVLFGLNRFFLAWIAALPSLWFAVHRAM